MHTEQKPRVGDPTSSRLIRPQKSEPTDHYRPALALILGAVVGAILGAALMGWWFSLSLSESKEIGATAHVFAEAATGSMKVALGIGAFLLLVMTLEIRGAWKASRLSQSPQVG